MSDIGHLPKTQFFAGEASAQGTAVDVDFPTDILWDDNSQILWDDATVIQWSNTVTTTPDVSRSFSLPRTAFAGSGE